MALALDRMTQDKDAPEPGNDPAGPDDNAGEEQQATAGAQPSEPEEPAVQGDEGEIPGDPETPVPSPDEIHEAMQWGFKGEEIEPELVERFAQHAQLVLETNRQINLTAITDPKEMAVKHYLDSWRVTRLIPLIARKVLDLGTGGGFPGQPLDPLVAPAIEENEERRAPRREDRLRHEREIHRILGVLAIRDDPAIDAGLAHEPGQEILEAVAKQSVRGLRSRVAIEDRRHRVDRPPLFESRDFVRT